MDHPLNHQGSSDHQQQQQQQQHQNSHHYQKTQQILMPIQGSIPIGLPTTNRNDYDTQQHHQYLAQQHQYLAQQHSTSPSRHHYSSHQQQQQQQQVLNNPMMQHVLQQPSGQYHPQTQQYAVQQYQQHQYSGQAQQAPPPTQYPSSGSRAKCDQVIYEAMAKACEIVARGRCTDLTGDAVGDANSRSYSDGAVDRRRRPAPEKRRSLNYGGGRRASDAAGSGGSTSGRFNIEVDEVPAVRSAAQAWRRAPHLPLRLDVYYEHAAELSGTDNPPSTPQRELLERWCFDYVPSTSTSNSDNSLNSPHNSPSSSPYSSRMNGSSIFGMGGNEKLSSSSNMSQLRRVCKRIVVLLRSLHCLTRMLPSYRLKRLLLSNGGPVVPPSMAAMGGWGSSGPATATRGSIGHSIHVGDVDSSALPSPSFARQSLPDVPTPYGTLRLSVMYDATLEPDRMVAELLERQTQQMQSGAFCQDSIQGQCPPQHQHPHLYLAGGQNAHAHQLQHPPPTYAEWLPPTGVAIAASTPPIPIIDPTTVPRPPFPVNDDSASDKPRSCPPARVAFTGGPASFGSTGPRTRAVSDFIIKDYHNSPKLKSASHSPSGEGGGNTMVEKQRVMSGLSLAMMGEDADSSNGVGGSPALENLQHNNSQQPTIHQQAHSTSPHEYGHYAQQQHQRQEIDLGAISFGSPATRAAFHNPPPKHGGYGYGYNGSNVQFGEMEPLPPPPPPLSTPPTPQGGILLNDYGRARSPGDCGSNDVNAPQFASETTFQPPLLPEAMHREGTPPTTHSLNVSRQNYNPNNSPGSVLEGKGSGSIQLQQRSRYSSSHQSVRLLPPVTSLDVLAKSPFLAMAERKTATDASAGHGEEIDDRNHGGGVGPFILGSDDFPSSIPRVVTDERNGSFAVSTLGGGGSSDNPLMPPMGEQQLSSATAASNRDDRLTEAAQQTEELPFAVDDDVDPSARGAASPLSSGPSMLLGVTRADVLEGTIGGGGGMAEVASTLAASSLHHRCAADGRVRLKMFEGVRTAEGVSEGGPLDPTAVVATSTNGGANPSSDFDSIEDQLTKFRSFGASLMVGSTDRGSQED